jgi:hypothetical protein
MLEVIVRRANLQTTGTIYHIETYLVLEGEAVKVELKINEQKTKYMIAVIKTGSHGKIFLIRP